MRSHQLFSLLRIRRSGSILLIFFACFIVQRSEPHTAPTASEDPAKIDQIWCRLVRMLRPMRARTLNAIVPKLKMCSVGQ